MQLMNNDRREACVEHRLKFKDLQPDWDRMRFRHVCPCANAEGFIWIRTAVVASLGKLFMILGKEYSAGQMYALYRTLRIV